MRSNKNLPGAVVTQRAARRTQARTECGFRDNSSLPHGIDEVILADNSIAVSNQIDEQVENLGFNRDDFVRTSQFIACNIDFEVREAEIQFSCPFFCAVPCRFRTVYPSELMGSVIDVTQMATVDQFINIIRSVDVRLLKREAAFSGGLLAVRHKLGKGTLNADCRCRNQLPHRTIRPARRRGLRCRGVHERG